VGIRAILLLVVLLPSVPMCFFRPFYGVLLWTVFSFASLQWYAWGVGYLLPTAEMVAIPTILGFLVFSRGGWNRLVSRETFLMLALWVWFLITSINSANTPLFTPHITETWSRLEFVSKILLMTLVTMGIVDSFARLRTLVIVVAGCFSFYVIKAIPFIILTGGNFRLYGPPKSMVEDNNDLGLALNMTLPILFFLAQAETDRRLKRVFWGLFAITIPAILCTYSRGALVGLVAVMIMMFLRLKRRVVWTPAILLAILIIALFAPEQWKERMDFRRQGAVVDESAYSRFNSWKFSWNLAKDYPIAGGGFETFTQELFDRYAPNTKDLHGPHSIYFGVLAEHGFVGLGLYLWLIVSCFASIRRIIKRAGLYGDKVAASYARMFGVSLVGFLTSGAFLGRAYFDYYFTVVALIVILKQVCFSEWRDRGVNEWQIEEQAA
jgi:putative inorganic carbon (hco3(-)) transporter